MIDSEFTLKLPNGPDIYFKHWQAEKPAALLCMVHGLGEHCNRYNHLAEFMNKNQVACLAYDLQGHGRSGGKRGHTPGFDLLLNEIELLLQTGAKGYPGLPVFLYGHSMGGNLVLNYVLKRKPSLAGVIATGSWIRLKKLPSAAIKFVATNMVSLLPSLSQSNNLNPNHISRDKKVVQEYTDDPLVHDRITLSTAVSVLTEAEFLETFNGTFSLPLLLMHGSGDEIVDVAGSQDFARRTSGPITLKIWEGLYHEIHNEPEQKEVFEYTLAWMLGIL